MTRYGFRFRFVEELPAPSRTAQSEYTDRALIDQFAAALRSRVGVWAEWPDAITRTTAHSYQAAIRKATLRAFRNGGYEAAVRGGALFVRYVGHDDLDEGESVPDDPDSTRDRERAVEDGAW